MGYSNPTQLRIGQSGTFFAKTYRIIGRAVLGISDFDATYYWNEFYLESAGGKPAILVFEETETGPSWKLFMMFDPEQPMTAAEAAAKKVDDIIEFEGRNLRITRVDHSKVYYTEGKTPEGVLTGKSATYFNADAGEHELVVSWTGDEVEFYSGNTTSTMMVASAFKFEGLSAQRFVSSSGRSWMSPRLLRIALASALVAILVFSCVAIGSRPRSAPPTAVTAAPPSNLKIGHACTVNNTSYKIQGHRLVEMAEMGRRWQRDEYDLQGAGEDAALLAHEKGANGAEWILYRQVEPQEDLTPTKAAALPMGGSFKIDNQRARVQELFRRTVKSAEGSPSEKAGDVTYGLIASANSNAPIFVCWNQTNVGYWQGARNSSVK